MTVGKEHIAGLQAALDLWNDGGPSVQYAHALADMIEQARAEPVQGEAVDVVAWMWRDINGDVQFNYMHPEGQELMTVAQHSRIMEAAKPDADLGKQLSWAKALNHALNESNLAILASAAKPGAELVELLTECRRYAKKAWPDGVHSYRSNSLSGSLVARIDAALAKLTP